MFLIYIDIISKLFPVLAILAAIGVARVQMKAARRATAMTIAKNHYRESLELFIKNSDIIFLGTKDDSYRQLVANVPLMRRYRWLFVTAMFSLQELYNVFVIGEQKDPYWARTIVVIGSLFRCHLMSKEHFPDYIRSGYNPGFLRFVLEGVQQNVHPAAATALSDFAVEDLEGNQIRIHQT